MKTVFLAVAMGLVGLCLPADAELIGSTVDVRNYYPDLGTLSIEAGSTIVSAALEYSNINSFAMDITDTQILLESSGVGGNRVFTGAAFNGFELLFSGVNIANATVDGGSTFLGNPAISIVGNNIFLNYSGVNTGGAPGSPTISIIDVTTSASGVPEPGTRALLGAGLLVLGFWHKRRSAHTTQQVRL